MALLTAEPPPSATTKLLVFVLVIDLAAVEDHDYEYDQDYEDFLRENGTILELALRVCGLAIDSRRTMIYSGFKK